jgi:gamma-D-glutamyl-L-lysine dipeptidyl-peptidase
MWTDKWSTWPTANHHIVVPVTTVWRGPDAPRSIDAPILQDQPRMERWVAALGIPERLDLLGRVQTQALLGEPVEVVGEAGEWSEVRLPWQPSRHDSAGYPGWIRSAHLAPRRTLGPPVVMDDRLLYTDVLPAPVSAGSVLELVDEDTTTHTLQLPNGTVIRRKRTLTNRTAQELAVPFLGVSYLWSGTSGWGVDCSGLVHICARAAGVLIPRDAADQFAHAEAGTLAIDPAALRWFVNAEGGIRHVGFTVPGDRMLHAPRTGFSVEVVELTEAPYAEDAVVPRAQSGASN